MEYDAACADKWSQQNKNPRITIVSGDQAKVDDLYKLLNIAGKDFDVMIDDGGHTMIQQFTSFKYLFPAVKIGGLYFLEDLHTSYWDQYGGGLKKEGTMIEHIKTMIDGMYMNMHHKDVGEPNVDVIESIHCMHELCVFEKKGGHSR
jgi:hypothetical protein